jgi:hypothetical protein
MKRNARFVILILFLGLVGTSRRYLETMRAVEFLAVFLMGALFGVLIFYFVQSRKREQQN